MPTKATARGPRAKRSTANARKALATTTPQPVALDPNSKTPTFDALTPRQQLFIRHWLVSLNGTQAAIAAGHSEASACAIGSENLRKPHIAKAISELIALDPRITATRIIQENAAIAFAKPQDFFTWGPGFVSIKRPAEIPEEAMGAIAGIVETPGQFGNKIELKLHDKGAALERLGKIFKMFGVDASKAGDTNINVNVVTGVMVAPQRLDEDDWFAAAKATREKQAATDALPVIDHAKS